MSMRNILSAWIASIIINEIVNWIGDEMLRLSKMLVPAKHQTFYAMCVIVVIFAGCNSKLETDGLAKTVNTKTDDSHITSLLSCDCNCDDATSELVGIGSAAYPTYYSILTHPNSREQHVHSVLIVLLKLNNDRRMFIQPAIAWLHHRNPNIRACAAWLLGQIGNSSNELAVIPLLEDSDPSVVFRAAIALEELGTSNSLSALEKWLEHPTDNNPLLRVQLVNSRDELKARLDKEEAERKK